MIIDFNDISGILDESNRTYKKDILDFDAVGEKLLNESSNNKVNESFGHNKISFNDFIHSKNLGPKTAQRLKQFLEDECGCVDDINEATLYRAYDNFRMYVADNNFFYPGDRIDLRESKEDFKQLNESLNESYAAAVYDPEDIRGETFYIDEDGELRDYLHQAKIFDTEEEAEEWAEENRPYNWIAYGSKLDEATVAQAKRFASRKHGETGAVRKATGQPYIVHPEGVAALVKENGGDDEQIQAAWLHDTIEDTGATYDDIVEKFGKRVADIVSEVTNKPHLKKSEKEAYMTNKLKNLSHDALLVKLCDMRYNYYDYAPIEQRMRIEKNIKELMSSRELTKEEWQLCEEILDWDNTVEGLDENAISKTLRLSSLNA